MLIERRSVEPGQCVRVGGKVRRHPVEDHADPAGVQRIDQRAELVGMPVARGGREVAGDLVSPGSAEGVLRDGQQLDVREAHLLDVVGELRSRLGPGQRAIALLHHAPPRADVHLVDGDGAPQRVRGRERLPRFRVLPLIPVERVHDRCRLRRRFGAEGEGVRLEEARPAAAGADLELVARARTHLRNEQLPDAGRADGAHRVQAAVPRVEIAHQRH